MKIVQKIANKHKIGNENKRGKKDQRSDINGITPINGCDIDVIERQGHNELNQ